MVTFRNNNNRRSNFRRNDRSYKINGERQKYSSSFSNNDNFKRKSPGRNNHNAAKLIEKYNDLAREASSNGDKILSENYLQHADHFMRIQNERENYRKEKYLENVDTKTEVSENSVNNIDDENDQKSIIHKDNADDTSENESQIKKSAKA